MPKVDISVIGTGRFGLFWSAQLAKYCNVFCFDREEAKLKYVRQYAKAQTLKQCLAKPFIFLTIPINDIPNFLRDNRSELIPGTVLVDCASVKTPVLKWFRAGIPEEVYFAASHPLFGPDSASRGLDGHVISLTPGRIPFGHYRFLVDLFSSKLRLKVLNLTAEEHDKMMAYNLSLMHHIGRTFHHMHIARIPIMMDNLKKISNLSEVVMRDSEELFCDFYKLNPYSHTVKEEFLAIFNQIEKDLIKPRS